MNGRAAGGRSRGAKGAPRRPNRPLKRRGRPKKAGIYPAADKCAGCMRKTGCCAQCEHVKHAEPATSAPAESPKPRERHAPERYEEAFPSEPRDQRLGESDHEAARKKLKPPPVKESPIVAWLTGAAVKLAFAKAARSLAEGKSEDVIAQVGSLVEESAFLKWTRQRRSSQRDRVKHEEAAQKCVTSWTRSRGPSRSPGC